ncbi:patatin-like phospholipase family protein [Tropicimonas sp. S265A]|uniref:patatin-like phospholipase family protein n=1 Tax=Tropicimonas sp. S265A TaxID=3415134 RepID=UPI003C7DE335
MAKRRINLALQGGGAHGAYTWGVLDRLLEEPEIEIAAISGTSAGALNGAAVKSGLSHGGSPTKARDHLQALWEDIGALTDPRLEPWLSLFPLQAIAKTIEASPAYVVGERVSQVLSPYDSPLSQTNPLERIVGKFTFDDICCESGPAFHICATNVRSGKIRVFTRDEISVDAIMASACLPTLFRAVEIHDPATGRLEAYWDGGYTGNPALFPFFQPDLPNDVVIININPLHREDVPRTGREIQNRINEISFNTSLLRELRAIDFVKRLLEDGKVSPGTMKEVYVHMIADDALMTQLSVATKTVPNPAVLSQLKTAGRAAAERFLDAHLGDINVCGTVDLRAMFG